MVKLLGSLLSIVAIILFFAFSDSKIIPQDQAEKIRNITYNLSAHLNGKSKAISIIKESMLYDSHPSLDILGRDNDMKFNTWLAAVSGIMAKISWDEFSIQDLESHIKAVEINVTSPFEGGGINKAKLQWLVNLNSEASELVYIEVNGEPKSIFSGLIAMESWRINY